MTWCARMAPRKPVTSQIWQITTNSPMVLAVVARSRWSDAAKRAAMIPVMGMNTMVAATNVGRWLVSSPSYRRSEM